MRTFTNLLEEALEAWSYTRAGVIAEVRNLPESGMEFRPAPESKTVLELGHHIARSGAMMSGELSRPEGEGDFQRKSWEELMHEHAADVHEPTDRDELIHLLERTLEEGTQRLEAAGEDSLLGTIRRFDGVHGTRLAWMNHGIAHEEYHRGQLALYARLQGVEPALTRLIRGG